MRRHLSVALLLASSWPGARIQDSRLRVSRNGTRSAEVSNHSHRQRRHPYQSLLVLMTVTVLLMGCAGRQSPILYPNAHLQQVSKQQADKDIEECRELASQYVPNPAGKDVAKNTGIGAVAGAAIGAVAGAVSGGGAGRGAGIGAATGGTAGAISGVAKNVDPGPAYKGFVDRCLRDRGYEVAGWQ
jgi:outer membrane lipoprotein SlyB